MRPSYFCTMAEDHNRAAVTDHTLSLWCIYRHSSPCGHLYLQEAGCREGEGGGVRMVRAVGIEPTILAERVFETRASTSFTTPARRYL